MLIVIVLKLHTYLKFYLKILRINGTCNAK